MRKDFSQRPNKEMTRKKRKKVDPPKEVNFTGDPRIGISGRTIVVIFNKLKTQGLRAHSKAGGEGQFAFFSKAKSWISTPTPKVLQRDPEPTKSNEK